MLARFQQFARERQMLMGVSPATLSWYKYSLMWLNSESPSQQELKDAVIRMREKGLRATGCNSAIRAINAYLHWNSIGSDAKCHAGCPHLKIPQLKEPQLILPTFTSAQVKLLVNFKPKGFYERRLHLMVCTLFDTGARISEVLGLNVSDIDLDNLLLTLDGIRPTCVRVTALSADFWTSLGWPFSGLFTTLVTWIVIHCQSKVRFSHYCAGGGVARFRLELPHPSRYTNCWFLKRGDKCNVSVFARFS